MSRNDVVGSGAAYVRWRTVPRAPVLVCVPWAGAGAAPFRPWADWLAPSVEVWALRLPGRESRIGEPPPDDFGRLVTDCADAFEQEFPVGRGYALFGHCSGALLSYELAHELLRRGVAGPRAFVVASQGAPDLPRTLDGWREDVDDLLAVAGADLVHDEEVHRELLELLRPTIEADVQLARGYLYRARGAFDVPVTVLIASDDPEIYRWAPRSWQSHTSAGVTGHVLPGDHLFSGAAWRGLAEAVGAALPPSSTKDTGGQ